MNGRPFFVPMIGIVLLFAGLGPAVGGALFIPLSVVFKTPTDLEAIGLMVLISTMFGHAFGLIAAYIVGVGPAAATGFLYALWDAVAPGRAPRALVAALIGGLLVYGLLLRLNPMWASFEMTIKTNMDPEAANGRSRADRRHAWPCFCRLRRHRGSCLAPSPQTSSGSPCDRN